MATALTVAAGAASAAPVLINFAGSPTQGGASLVYQDVTITGSGTVENLELNGMGIGDSMVGHGEWITFTFSQPVDNVTVVVSVAGGGSAVAPAGARTVEVFDGLGNSLGSSQQSLVGTFDISAIAGGGSLSYFTMTAAPTTTFRIQQLSYELAPLAAVPLPAGAPALLAAIGALALLRRRNERTA